MENVFEISRRLVESVDCAYIRGLYDRIHWDWPLILIKGARGVGKTTLMLQRMSLTSSENDDNLYASLDNIWFTTHSILDLVQWHYGRGGRHLFLDEVHRYNGPWQQELKNVYDSYPDYHVVFTGSSVIQLDPAVADLSRRLLSYEMYGLSYAEYLEMAGHPELPRFTLEELTRNPYNVATGILAGVDVKNTFPTYLQSGYYPYFNALPAALYLQQVQRTVDTVVLKDIPTIDAIEYSTLNKIRRVLGLLSEMVPYTLNIEKLSTRIGMSRGQLLKVLGMLDRGAILRQIFAAGKSMRTAVKPEKLLFDNTNILAALSTSNEIGTVRETFAASMLAPCHELVAPKNGDIMVDGRYVFEIGGPGKGYKQIAGVPNSYILSDEIEPDVDINRIPLWLLGFTR